MKLDDHSSRIVAHRFRHALLMVTDLIPHTDSPGLPETVRVACLEDWFTNYRMLIEFLLLPESSNRASAPDLVPNWAPANTAAGRKMRADYGFASEHVSHISGTRNPPRPHRTSLQPYCTSRRRRCST